MDEIEDLLALEPNSQDLVKIKNELDATIRAKEKAVHYLSSPLDMPVTALDDPLQHTIPLEPTILTENTTAKHDVSEYLFRVYPSFLERAPKNQDSMLMVGDESLTPALPSPLVFPMTTNGLDHKVDTVRDKTNELSENTDRLHKKTNTLHEKVGSMDEKADRGLDNLAALQEQISEIYDQGIGLGEQMNGLENKMQECYEELVDHISCTVGDDLDKKLECLSDQIVIVEKKLESFKDLDEKTTRLQQGLDMQHLLMVDSNGPIQGFSKLRGQAMDLHKATEILGVESDDRYEAMLNHVEEHTSQLEEKLGDGIAALHGHIVDLDGKIDSFTSLESKIAGLEKKVDSLVGIEKKLDSFQVLRRS
jgi:hypothetical protein